MGLKQANVARAHKALCVSKAELNRYNVVLIVDNETSTALTWTKSQGSISEYRLQRTPSAL